jgi:PKD repeat protein
MRHIFKYGLFFLLFLRITTSFGAAPPLLDWQKCLGGSGQDLPVKLIPCSGSGFWILGSTGSINGDVTFNHGSNDIWVVRTDSSGSVIWQKSFGGSSMESAGGCVDIGNGKLVIAGNTASSNGDITYNHGNFDTWLFCIDTTGTILWQRTYGGTQVDMCYSLNRSTDGGFVVAGGSYSNDGDVNGNHGNEDFWVFKTDSIGNLLWQRSLGGSGLDVCYSMAPDGSTGFIACGTSNSSNGNISLNHGGYDYWVVHLDGNGNLLWEKSLGGSLYESAFSIAAIPGGTMLVSGYSKSVDGDVTDNKGYSDYWAVNLDAAGNILLQRSFGGSAFDVVYSAIPTADGGFLLAGGTTSNDWDVSANHGQEDVWLTKTDSQLNIEWTRTYGGSANERPASVLQNADGGFTLAGYTYSNNGNVSGNHGGSDIWLVNLACKVPQAQFSTSRDTVCTFNLVNFSNSSLLSSAYTWTVNSFLFSTSENAVIQFPSDGSYQIGLIAQTCYYSDTAQTLLTSVTLQPPVIQSSGSFLCTGDTLQLSAPYAEAYFWNTTETSSQIDVTSGNTYDVTVYQYGCSASSQSLTIPEYSVPVFELGPDTAFCSGDSITLHTVPGMPSYSWQDGTHDSVLVVKMPGLYSVTVSNGHCAYNDSLYADTLYCAVPQANFVADQTVICQHSSIQFSDLSQNTGVWNWVFPGGNPATSTQRNPVVTYDVPGIYSVLLTAQNVNGSQSMYRSNYIYVDSTPAKPSIQVSGYLLTSTPAVSYQWYLNGVPITGANQQAYLAPVSGYYSVEGGNSNSCTALSDSVYVLLTGIQNRTISSFSVFPNPVKNKIYIQSGLQTMKPVLLRLSNAFGQVIFEKNLNEISPGELLSIDFPESAPGSYFLILSFEETKVQYMLIKE